MQILIRMVTYLQHRKGILAFYCLFSLLVYLSLLLFWPAAHILGGDDAGLYYTLPKQMLEHYVRNLISDSVPGGQGQYFPQLYQVTFFTLIYFLKTVTFDLINLQKLMLGANIVLGHAAFVLLYQEISSLFLKRKVPLSLSMFVGGGLYIFSPMLAFSTWYHLLSVVYLQTVFPVILFLWIRSITHKSLTLLVVANIISSIFMINIVAFPHLLGTILAVFPLIIYVFVKQPKRAFIGTITLLLLVVLTNLHVFTHLFLKIGFDRTSKSNILNSVTSKQFKERNESSITYSGYVNRTLYTILNVPQKGYLDQNQTYNKTKVFYSFNMLLSVILLVSLVLHAKNKSGMRIVILMCFLLIVRLYTVSTPIFGTDTFLLLSRIIPLFTALRTTIDKFSIGFSLIYALLLTISIDKVSAQGKSGLIKSTFIGIVIVVIVLNSLPILGGIRYKQPDYGGDKYKLLNGFDKDFLELTEYIKRLPDDGSRFIWFPLNIGGYAILPDTINPHYYYVGLSPLLFLAARNDYTGYLGIPSGLNDKVFNSIRSGDWQTVGRVLQELNIRYVIINKSIPSTVSDSYLIGRTFHAKQKGVTNLLGNKLATFGDRYEIYSLKSEYWSKKISLADRNINTQVVYTKNGVDDYSIELLGLSDSQRLVFTDVNSSLWRLIPSSTNFLDNTRQDFFIQSNSPEYKNIWEIDIHKVKSLCQSDSVDCRLNSNGTYDLSLKLLFLPDKLVTPTIIIDLISHMILICVLIAQLFRPLRRLK